MLLLLVGHFAVALKNRQVQWQPEWPFVYYFMFSHLQTKKVATTPLIVGITDDNEEIELMQWKYFYPFSIRYLQKVFRDFKKRQDPESHFASALRDLLLLYEKRRLEKGHDGPLIKGIRFYHIKWSVDPTQTSGGTPIEKTLFAEYKNTENNL